MNPLQYGATKVAQLADEAIGRGFLFRGKRLPASLAARIEFKALADSPDLIPYPYPVVALDGSEVLLSDGSDVAELWTALCTHVVACRSAQAAFAAEVRHSDGTQESVDAIVIRAIAWARLGE